MKIVCRSLDITDEELNHLLENEYNDLKSLILRLSGYGHIDYYCLMSILEYIKSENIEKTSDVSMDLEGDDFIL